MARIVVTPERKAILCRALFDSAKPLSAIELAASLAINNCNIWHIANIMEEEGLISRKNVAKNGLRKKSYFSLTDYGAEIANGLVVEPTGEARELSIRDFCNDVAYRQWLGKMTQVVRGTR